MLAQHIIKELGDSYTSLTQSFVKLLLILPSLSLPHLKNDEPDTNFYWVLCAAKRKTASSQRLVFKSLKFKSLRCMKLHSVYGM